MSDTADVDGEAAHQFRAAAEAGFEDDGYEPQLLWRIPIYLRSRKQYYAESIKRISALLEEAYEQQVREWSSPEGATLTREAWERSAKRYIDGLWSRQSPPWWGLHDAVGWIEIYGDTRAGEIWATLLLPRERISRQLTRKTFWHHDHKIVQLWSGITNDEIRHGIFIVVNELIQAPKLQKLFLDLEPWRRLVNHTDIAGVLTGAAAADLERQNAAEVSRSKS